MTPLALPRVVGHRGAAASAPENTVAGLRRAAALGCRMVEFDAKLTRDGVPICLHDDTLDRTTTGSGAVRDTDWAAIEGLDAGRFFSAGHAGEPVPSLEAYLRAALALELGLNIEIKPCRGREEETARIVLETALAVWPGDAAPPLVSSFSTESLVVAHEVAPAWPRGWLVARRPEDWRAILARIDARAIHFGAKETDPATLAEYRMTGLPLLVYTVNDPAEAARWYDEGVTAVITDAPDRILPVAEESSRSAG